MSAGGTLAANPVAQSDITQLLSDWKNGDTSAADKLLPLVYDELHRAAVRAMNPESSDHTPQPTALVNAAYLRTDPELRREVESLLLAAGSATSLPTVRAAIASAAASMVEEQNDALRSLLEATLGHQYEIVRCLGRGGMGCVYLARERALERFVAIKVLRPDLADAEDHRERFRREARIVARLSHPGILGLHSFGEIGGLWYFVMNYVRGETLADRIRREGMLPWVEAHQIFVEMADALECAHRNGVVHRDIKPANILLDRESGHAILADFGISKLPGAARSLTATGAIVGTPDYMSPEQVLGDENIDERADLYSLGAVAYVMLTGTEPFRSETAGATIYRRLTNNASPVNTVVATVPPDLSAIIEKCMAREKTDRWPDARALKDALESVLAVDRLPDAVRDLPGFGPYALLWLIAWLGLAVLKSTSPSETAVLTIVALVVPIGLLLHLWNGVRRGMRLVDLARVASWPPEWWGLWWPRTLRRPSDIWVTLPLPARAIRIFLIALCPAMLFLVLIRDPSHANAKFAISAGEWAILVVGAGATLLATTWAMGKGLTLDQSLRFVLGPTLSSSTWKEAAMDHLLLSAAGNVRLPDNSTPADYARAIREVVPLFPVGGEIIGREMVNTAERLLSAIDQRDPELASLGHSASREEVDRLVSQLDSLVPKIGDTGERIEMRELIQNQLDLVHRMQVRREVVLSERENMIVMLRRLWTLAHEHSRSVSANPVSIDRLRLALSDVSSELESIQRREA